MIAAAAAFFARPISKAAIVALGVAAMLALGGLGAWRAAAAFRAVVDQAVVSAKAERDAYWRAQISEANVKVARAEAEQARAASAADKTIRAAESSREDALKELEKRNAALADSGRCGLGRARVRLLNKAR